MVQPMYHPREEGTDAMTQVPGKYSVPYACFLLISTTHLLVPLYKRDPQAGC